MTYYICKLSIYLQFKIYCGPFLDNFYTYFHISPTDQPAHFLFCLCHPNLSSLLEPQSASTSQTFWPLLLSLGLPEKSTSFGSLESAKKEREEKRKLLDQTNVVKE